MKFVLKMMNVYVSSNGTIGKSTGPNIWLNLFIKIVGRVRLTRNMSLIQPMKDILVNLHNLNVQSNNVVLQLVMNYVNSITDDSKQWVLNFYQTFLTADVKNITPQNIRIFLGMK